MFSHEIRQYPGDPTIDMLAFDSGYYIPESKSRASISWNIQGLTWTVEGQRLSRIPNYAETAYIRSSLLFNSTLQYDFTDHLRGSLAVTNVFDTKPVRDPTYSAYPYFDVSWFDSVGRSVFMQLTYKFGGAAL